MKNRGRLNRGIATVLSAALLVGMSPAIPDMSLKAYADTATAIDMAAPSVQAYADKTTLMDETFAPGTDGKNETVGLLYFGTNGTDPQKWYILGKDDQVKDEEGNDTDNIAIFAASNITNNCFYKEMKSHSYVGDADEAYVTESEKPSSVCGNHYGESDIRSALRKMAGEEEDTSEGKVYDRYFTTTEKKMLQKTKVLTHEYNNNHLYTTNDKLYLASGEYRTDKIIYVGSVGESGGYVANDEYTSIKLSCENYWHSSSMFWLRSPYSFYSDYALFALPRDGGISGCGVSSGDRGVRPASNLNLKDVLFASAAPAAESVNATGGIIKTSETEQAAMTLRLDGSDKHIGSFTYDDSVIKVKHGSTKSNVSLVVQGNNGTCDWYFCKQISSDYDEEIYPSAIESAFKAGTGTLTISADDIKFTDPSCKIWLEIPDEYDSTLAYAVDKNTKQQHVHVYPTNKATPTELMKSDADYHWWECTDEECPDLAGSIMNMTGELGQKDAHNWVKTQEDADKDKTIFETYFKDKENFLKDGTGNVEYKLNSEDNTKHDRITTYYYYCQDCKYVDKEHTFTYKEIEDHKYTEEHNGYTRLPDKHYKECTVCGYISNEGKHKYDDDNDRDCNVCGYERGHNHFPLVHVEGLEPTCTEDGNTEYYHCGNGCDFISKDSIGLVPITRAETVLEATGHKAAGYKSDSSKHWKICENEHDGEICGERFAEGAHTFSGNKCTVCGYTRRSAAHNSERYNTDSGSSSDSSSSVSSTIINNITGTTVGNGSTAGWSKDASGRWWYYDAQHGKSLGWIYDKTAGKWYYADESKGMLTGWFYDNEAGYWYYLDNTTGEMLTGWQLIGGKQYYFAPAPQAATYTFDESSFKWVYSNAANNRPYGSMYANTLTPDNQRVDADGARIQ